MMIRPRRALALAAALTVLLAGCASAPGPVASDTTIAADPLAPLSGLEVLEQPRDWTGPTTAVLAERPFPRLDGTPEQSLPVTVTSYDLGGSTQQTVAAAERIVPMDIAGSIAATVFGLGFGDRVVGRDISTTFDEAAELPVITAGSHTINIEAVIALRPDLVITDGSIGPVDVVLQLREAGVTVVFVQNDPSLDGVGTLTRQVAAALGAPDAGERFAAMLDESIDAKIAEIRSILPAAEPLRMMFLYLRGGTGIYYLFGEESGADALITALGGIDVAAELGFEGMRPMTDEAMVAARPELILLMSGGLASAGGVDGLLEAKPAIALTPAGQQRRIVDMADGDVLAFGPRTADVLDALARAIYAPGQ